MGKYDVVIVGAGPAGTSAAKAASKKGAKTIILEEHPSVGLPRHCTGRIHGSSFTEDAISGVDKRIILAECKRRRYFSPGGKEVLDSPLPPGSVYMILRDMFDKELAKQAVESGTKILLNTRVSRLLKQDGLIRGVLTESKDVPSVAGKIVIVAQGVIGRLKGIPKQESLSFPDESSSAGVMIELTNVHNIESGVLETHLGAMVTRGHVNLWPLNGRSCLLYVSSLAILEEIKRGGYLISRKIRDGVPIQLYGCASGSKPGIMLPKLVKDGLILIGDSAGYASIIHAIISGRYAGEVAATAIQEDNTSEQKLQKYEDMCRQTGLHLTGTSRRALGQLNRLSDTAIEAIIPEMLSRNELNYSDVWPF